MSNVAVSLHILSNNFLGGKCRGQGLDYLDYAGASIIGQRLIMYYLQGPFPCSRGIFSFAVCLKSKNKSECMKIVLGVNYFYGGYYL